MFIVLESDRIVVLQYPESCGAYKIKYIRDLTAGYDNSRPDNNPVS